MTTFFLAPLHLLHVPADAAEAHFQIPGDLGLFDSGVEHGGNFLAELLVACGREEDAEFLGEGLAGFEAAAAADAVLAVDFVVVEDDSLEVEANYFGDLWGGNACE